MGELKERKSREMDVPNLTLSICSFSLCFFLHLKIVCSFLLLFFVNFFFLLLLLYCCCCFALFSLVCLFFVSRATVLLLLLLYHLFFGVCYCQILILHRGKSSPHFMRAYGSIALVFCHSMVVIPCAQIQKHPTKIAIMR